ncbi:MAG: LPS export ABC transporter permease LptF [Cocleimonas sp.]|nr:LPS export ABC transporter permease LptF [Cocleimonas sp.]
MIIQRYLLREILQSFVGTLLILLLIIVGNTFVRLLSKVSSGGLPIDLLGKMVLMGSINGAIQLIPVALLIGMMLAFGRLYRDNEISALHSSGVGPRAFYKGIFLFVAPLTLLLSFMVLYLVPTLERTTQTIKTEVKQRPEASGIPVGEFMHTKIGDRRFTIFVEKMGTENVVMEHFFMHSETDTKETVLTAKKALLFVDQQNGERVLQVNNGSRYDYDVNNNEFLIFRFGEHGLRVPSTKITNKNELTATSTAELLLQDTLASKAELHWRLAIILSAPIVALLAFPLSYTTPRQGRFGKLALGILLYAIYANLLMTGKSLLAEGKIPSIIGLWWVHLLFIALALWLVRKQYGKAG